MNHFYIPNKDNLPNDNMWRWYQNVIVEVGSPDLSDSEKREFGDYYREAGLLRTWRRPFFKAHFSNTFERASAYVLGSKTRPTIVDLGCGTGTQSLYFALLGASVAAFDMDEVALEIFRKRIDAYQMHVGRSLDIEIYKTDTLTFDYEQIGPIDGIYSMFAFNMMQPTRVLFEKLDRAMVKGSRIAIIDGNSSSWLPLVVPARRRNVWSPKMFAENLKASGYRVDSHQGGIVFPPLFWKFMPDSFISPFDSYLSKNWLLPISHQVLAEKLH